MEEEGERKEARIKTSADTQTKAKESNKKNKLTAEKSAKAASRRSKRD